jgi:hypothetical protein
MENIKSVAGSQPAPSFLESMAGMFGKGYPDGVSTELVTKAMTDWKHYWMFPAGMALVVAVIFAIAFRDHSADAKD